MGKNSFAVKRIKTCQCKGFKEGYVINEKIELKPFEPDQSLLVKFIVTPSLYITIKS